MDISGNYRNVLTALTSAWQAHRRLRNQLLTAMRKDTCPTLRRILEKAYLTSVIFERDIEELYDSLKSYLHDSRLDETGFDPGLVRQHGVNVAVVMETITQQQSALMNLYKQLLDLICKEGFAQDWCEQHLQTLASIHAATTSKVQQLFDKSDSVSLTTAITPIPAQAASLQGKDVARNRFFKGADQVPGRFK